MADELDVVVGDNAEVRLLTPLTDADIESWRMVGHDRVEILDGDGVVLAAGNPGVIGANALSDKGDVPVIEVDAQGPAAAHLVRRAE